MKHWKISGIYSQGWNNSINEKGTIFLALNIFTEAHLHNVAVGKRELILFIFP